MLNDAEHQDLQSEVENQPVMAGVEVFDVNGHKVGEVSDRGLQADALIVEKGIFFPREVYIPLSAIQARLIDGIHLSISKDDISSRNWDRAPAEPAQRVASDDTGAGRSAAAAPQMDARDQLAEPPDMTSNPDAQR